MKIIKIIFVSLLTISICNDNVFAKDTKSTKVESKKREYTEEEFKVAVLEEATKLMKKTGSGHIVDFSKELLEKEEAIKLKEMDVKKKYEALAINEEGFKKKLIEFQGEQSKFIGCIEEKSAKSNARVAHMVEIIS